eukprot:7689213-Ditylum_brightwellii.AAC.1
MYAEPKITSKNESRGPKLSEQNELRNEPKPIEQKEPRETKQEKTWNFTRFKKQINVEEHLDKQGRLHRDAMETIIKVLLVAWSLTKWCCKITANVGKKGAYL